MSVRAQRPDLVGVLVDALAAMARDPKAKPLLDVALATDMRLAPDEYAARICRSEPDTLVALLGLLLPLGLGGQGAEPPAPPQGPAAEA